MKQAGSFKPNMTAATAGSGKDAEKTYIAIDLKSFYASVECVQRGLDPLSVNLVVADESRTEKTICLAVSPALKEYGVPGRPRLFEVAEKVRAVNAKRREHAPARTLSGKSVYKGELISDPSLAVDYIVAPPRMELYEKVSAQIFGIYAEFVSPEDIHVYSIDEVFIDATGYLARYRMSGHELAMRLIREVLSRTGITATAGVGSNLFLCKVAMDIVAKHMPPDRDGVRIAELDEMEYRKMLWGHRPITDFWRVGRGYARRLEEHGMYTMGDVALCSVRNEDLLFQLFGVNAELLIDHAWGWEPCTIAQIKAYRPQSNSLGAGQVLQSAYSFEKGGLIVREMADALALDLVEKGLVTDQIVLGVDYDTESLKTPEAQAAYAGEIVLDGYGRQKPKPAHGSVRLKAYTSSARQIMEAAFGLYRRIADPRLLVRKLFVTASRVLPKEKIPAAAPQQLDLFTDHEAREREARAEEEALGREQRVQEAVLSVHKKFGKNALVRGMDLEEGATTRERNGQIGGHKK